MFFSITFSTFFAAASFTVLFSAAACIACVLVAIAVSHVSKTMTLKRACVQLRNLDIVDHETSGVTGLLDSHDTLFVSRAVKVLLANDCHPKMIWAFNGYPWEIHVPFSEKIHAANAISTLPVVG